MSDIFICYSRKDLEVAEQLVQQFRQEGWNVFIDRDTPTGRRWHKEIEHELHSARAVVVLWSATSRESDFVLEEAEYGKRKNILFPAFIERIEFPYGFSRIQAADLSNWHNNPSHTGWITLLQSLRLHLNGRKMPFDSSLKQDTNESSYRQIRKPLVSGLLWLGIIIFFSIIANEKLNLEELEKPINNDTPVKIPPNKATERPKDQAKTSQQLIQKQKKESPSDVQAEEDTVQSIYLVDKKFLPELIHIPSGSFMMGEQNEAFIKTLSSEHQEWDTAWTKVEPQALYGVPGKQIEITRPFYLGKTEVTYEQYDYYVHQQKTQGAQIEGRLTPGKLGNQPVVYINWHEAVAYTKWLSKHTNNQCRLPTEAEWEYAARAGTTYAYPWGNDVGNNNAKCLGCNSEQPNKEAAPVSSFAPNQFGLYDMSGNVWEWTCSNWRKQFDDSEKQCNDNTVDTQNRVVRGGSWGFDSDSSRSSARKGNHPNLRFNQIGFRALCASPIE